MRQTSYLIELAEEAGVQSDESKGGETTRRHDHGRPRTCRSRNKELIRREIIVDYRPGAGVRISPHFYTTDNELELAIKEMKKIAESESYREHETAGAAF